MKSCQQYSTGIHTLFGFRERLHLGNGYVERGQYNQDWCFPCLDTAPASRVVSATITLVERMAVVCMMLEKEKKVVSSVFREVTILRSLK